MGIDTSLCKFFNDVVLQIRLKSDKRFGEISFKNSAVDCKLEYFDVGNGLGYCAYEGIYNENLKYSFKRNAQSFLCFNVGSEHAFIDSDLKSVVLKPTNFCIGTVQGEVLSGGEYKVKSCKTQTIIISNELMSEFGLNFGDEKFNAKTNLINPSQSLILKELLNSQIYSGKMREIFIESKILEMVYKTLGYAQSEKLSVCKSLKFDDIDIKNIMKAKEILLKNLQNPPTIKELARLCATNEFKLKIGFKRSFGVSIHKFLQNERLEISKKLLKSDDISVKEAAMMVGYNNFAHFSKIFKEKFGILPNELIKERKIYIF